MNETLKKILNWILIALAIALLLTFAYVLISFMFYSAVTVPN